MTDPVIHAPETGTAPDPWTACQARIAPGLVEGDLLRLVESQEQVATTSLVDDLAEQSVLEDLLETTKPPRRTGTAGMHYLLASPFRYPPLRHGSRFGSRFEPGIFYGARELTTALAEGAYYRLVFWTGMDTPPPSGRLLTQHTVYRACYRAACGLRLQEPPCAEHEPALRHPTDYAPTQRLGRALRGTGVELVEYRSARDPAGGINVAVFAPRVLTSRRPLDPQAWLCETRADRVVYSGPRGRTVLAFALTQFTVAGRLPVPAA